MLIASKLFLIKKIKNLKLISAHSKQEVKYQNNLRKTRYGVCMLTFFFFFFNSGAVVIGDLNYYVSALRYFASS